jgi:enterochelin esterase-like enzyme
MRPSGKSPSIYRLDTTAKTSLPLLILHDGQNLFEPERAHVPGQHWQVAETADTLIATGAIPPIVIAGVDPRRRRTRPRNDADTGR